MALDEIGADFDHWKVVEFDKYAVASYNAVHDTNFPVTDIRNVHGSDLDIIDTDRYTYFLTYSFPCTDLSVAGKMKGMKKGSGTRSGLLWEVERILKEIHYSGGELPQVLFMENVPQVISPANIDDFHDWQDFLSSLGYTSYVSVLNAKDYGVAQNRERCFMFSFLGEYNYKFPDAIPLNKTMKDYLEDEVDEKYYINTEKAQKLICQLIDSGNLQGCIGNVNPSGNGLNGNVYSGDIAPTLTTNKGEGQKICIDLSINNPKKKSVSNCITARENRGISNQESVGNGVLQIGNIMEESSFSNPQTGRIYDSSGCAPTLNTCGGGGHEPKTIVAMRGRNPDNSSDRTVGSPTEQRLEQNSKGICNTLTSVQKDNMVLEKRILGGINFRVSKEFQHGMLPYMSRSILANNDGAGCIEETVRIKQATKDGYIECKVGGVADFSYPNSDTRRGRVQDNGDTCPTITATETGICRIESLYRIRKLTPRECGRLMAVSDSNIDRILSVVSNSQAYKQFGNSIVATVMVAMFSNLNIQGLPRWDEIKSQYT